MWLDLQLRKRSYMVFANSSCQPSKLYGPGQPVSLRLRLIHTGTLLDHLELRGMSSKARSAALEWDATGGQPAVGVLSGSTQDNAYDVGRRTSQWPPSIHQANTSNCPTVQADLVACCSCISWLLSCDANLVLGAQAYGMCCTSPI